MAWATKVSTTTKHTCNNGNGPAFGKKTAGCPRCDELLDGAAPVKGWGYSKDQEAARNLRAILKMMECKGEPHERNLNPGGYCTVCGAGYGD
jgi:hypothetical protein